VVACNLRAVAAGLFVRRAAGMACDARFLGGVSGPRGTGVTAAIWVALLRHPEPQRHEASHRNREIERPYNRL
jgi:hypothetical protein